MDPSCGFNDENSLKPIVEMWKKESDWALSAVLETAFHRMLSPQNSASLSFLPSLPPLLSSAPLPPFSLHPTGPHSILSSFTAFSEVCGAQELEPAIPSLHAGQLSFPSPPCSVTPDTTFNPHY